MKLLFNIKDDNNEHITLSNILKNELSLYLRFYDKISWDIDNDILYFEFDENNIVMVNFVKYIVNKYELNKIDERYIYDDIKNTKFSDVKVLPIIENNDITLVPIISLLMQIPFIDNISSWYYNNFINIQYNKTKDHGYLVYANFLEDIFDVIKLRFDELPTFNNNDIFISVINKNYYIFTRVDNFYMPNSTHYTKNHDVHEILIYGYDKNKSIYNFYFFETTRGIIRDEIFFNDVHLAIESARIFSTEFQERTNPVKFLKPKKMKYEYNCFYDMFIKKIHDYIYGVGDIQELFYLREGDLDNNNDKFGINITKEIINAINQGNYPVFDYRIMHMVIENKMIILKILQYIKDKYNPSNYLISLIDNYEELVNIYISQKNKYIKQSLIENDMKSFYPVPQNKRFTDKMCKILSKTLKSEMSLLNELYCALLQKMSEDNKIGNKLPLIESNYVENNKDDKGFYYYIKWNMPIFPDFITLFEINNHLEGEIIFDDETIFHCDINDIQNHFLYFSVENKEVNWIKYYPKVLTQIDNKLSVCVNVYGGINILKDSHITCSSVYSKRTDTTFVPENVISFDENMYWTPEEDDNKRYIQFEFTEPKTVNQFNIQQFAFPPRVEGYRIDYSIDGITYMELLSYRGVLGNKINKHIIKPVQAKSIRLNITNCFTDDFGYNLPMINYFAAYSID